MEAENGVVLRDFIFILIKLDYLNLMIEKEI